MHNNKGFTLLELLIAATIVGLLAVFATVAFKESAADNRINASKIKTDQLAAGMQRFRLDHPLTIISGQDNHLMGNLTDHTVTCQPRAGFAKTLITCDYVDNGGWTDKYVAFYVCDERDNSTNPSACSSSALSKPLACMVGRSHPRLPVRYRGVCGYRYCVSATGSEEVFGNSGGDVACMEDSTQGEVS